MIDMKQRGKPQDEQHAALITISIDTDLEQLVRFDVNLGSLPHTDYQLGFEVEAAWVIADFDNNNTFYTDSNGLQMQKRVLNYRPTWDIQKNYNDSNENITANYYPVNTAVQMTDLKQNKIFTVMNDRSQAGSALDAGQIQLM